MVNGVLILLFGTSGSGKTSIGRELIRRGIPELVSHTTRPMRKGEVDGVDYHFCKEEVFRSTEMAEQTSYNSSSGSHFYGISRKEIEKKLEQYPAVFAIVDQEGVRSLKRLYPEKALAVYVYISEQEMYVRMNERGDSRSNIEVRIDHARKNGEFDLFLLADHVVENRDFKQAIEQTLNFIKTVKRKEYV